MFKFVMRAAVAGVMVLGGLGSASATTLLTSGIGYEGPALLLPEIPIGFTYTGGPVALPGGVTFSSNVSYSGYGNSPANGYWLGPNGSFSGPIIFSSNGLVTFTFDTAVESFGAMVNYSPDAGDPSIAAYDVDGGLIATYDLALLAPISTPDGTNAFAFRGIDGEGTLIKSFTMTGGYILARAEFAQASVPEPASWAMMVGGFGLIGGAMRARRRAIVAA